MTRSAILSRRVIPLATAVAAAAAMTLIPTGAMAAPTTGCENRTNNTIDKLLLCVDADGAFEHLAALQAIADENGDTRAAGTPGYDQSVDYVVDTLEAAGWNVTTQAFPFEFTPLPTLEQLTPTAATYTAGSFTATGTGTVQGNVIPVDVDLVQPVPDALDSGCTASDFAGLDFSGTADIALIQRGTCEFGVKATNAQTAGAEAVIIFNQGNTPLREGVVSGTLIGMNQVPLNIPVVGASFADGVALGQPNSTARVSVGESVDTTVENVIAELPGNNPDNVVMAGAHLDSVQQGPGINDNGSGSASLLELAQQISKVKPENTIRLAWWGAEEAGLLGSQFYVDSLSQAERDRIALYLNFDMVASPNFIYMVYDGDESSFVAPVVVPEGSIQIEDVFESYFTGAGVPYEDAEFSGRSDYQAFIEAGIPAGGLFTGAEVPKTPEQEAIWGGVAGQQYDPCYHQACDDIENVSMEALDVNIDAIAFAVLYFAYTTEVVNEEPGRNVPGGINLPTPAGEEGTVGSQAGGLAPDHGHGDAS